MAARVALTFGLQKKAPPYRQALLSVGLEPVDAWAREPIHTLDGVDGLLLSGGTDIEWRRYGADRHPTTSDPDRERDEMELELLRQAMDRRLPIFAICRGHQLLNIALGGKLIQDIPGHQTTEVPAHEVVVQPGTRLQAITGQTRFQVNSRHHQAVNPLAPGLVATAHSEDGIVEGMELRDYPSFLMSVQWHPEDTLLTNPPDRALFEAFAAAVRG